MKHIIFHREDGLVQICTPTPEFIAIHGEEKAFDIVRHKDLPKASCGTKPVEHWDVSHEDILTNQAFRDAWRYNGTQIEVDMTTARAIKMESLRSERNDRLKKLDIDYQRAHEKQDMAGMLSIAQAKQKLRDLPATADLTQHATPEALESFQPSILTTNEESS